VDISSCRAAITNGELSAEITEAGRIRYLDSAGRELLAEISPLVSGPAARRYAAIGGMHRFEVAFCASDGERFYGLGQHQHGLLDQKGSVIDLVQRNTEVCIPFLVSSRGYGFLWNHPGTGRVELGTTSTRWAADAIRQWDYWVVAGDKPSRLLGAYADVTGHAPMLPEWASGFWQSKLRYRTQDELLAVAREYRRRGLPLSVIVVDFLHWPHQGDWRFDPAEWPDPAGMVAELDRLGVQLMVSIWPAASPLSRGYEQMAAQGLLLANEHGISAHLPFWDKGSPGKVLLTLYDPTNPRARRFLWAKAREGYYQHGIRAWWLDACEPELEPEQPENLRYHIGPGAEVTNIYPLMHARAFFDGMRAEGEQDVVLLCRSAWAGSQRYGVAVWSGDIESSFGALRRQIPAGLNIAMSGIPWWTTDIGGFSGGDNSSPSFRELIVRWFQFAVFCPILRLHGARQPVTAGAGRTGGPNEVWSFGEPEYRILRRYLFLREQLRPYVLRQMRTAHETGVPPMRPLFVEFPDDPVCWQIADQFLLGGDLLIAPVTEEKARQREVYLPAGAAWRDAWTGRSHDGGQWVTRAAPLDIIPVYLKAGAGAGAGLFEWPAARASHERPES
jgi:alpha-D-xyloside xylohydrolase